MDIILNGNKFLQFNYKSEEEFENDIVASSKSLFGKKTVYIDCKKKISGNILGNAIPDGFLIDFSDIKSPEFYIVEVELAKHDFYKHIFPQVTKFLNFFTNANTREELADKIHSIIESDNNIKNDIKSLCKSKEIYKLLKDCINSNQNILIVIDETKPEITEISNTYKEWNNVKLEIVKKFINGSDVVFVMEPRFDEIGYLDLTNINETYDGYTEDEHLDKAKEPIKEIYYELKSKLLKIKSSLIFNPQKFYISIKDKKNIVYIKIQQKKIRIIVMLDPVIIKESIKKCEFKELTQGVQNFYNGPCASIELDNKANLNEVIELIKKLL